MFIYRAEAMEKTMQLRTKAMREKEELREMRKYRFALIRIRLPDGIFLQVYLFLKYITFCNKLHLFFRIIA